MACHGAAIFSGSPFPTGVVLVPHPHVVCGGSGDDLPVAKELGGVPENHPMTQQETTRPVPAGAGDAHSTALHEELDISTFAHGFVHDLHAYAKAEKRYLILRFSERTGTLMAKGWSAAVGVACCTFTMFFLNTALAWAIGEALGSMPLGFVLVAGFYVLALGVFVLMWRSGARDRFIINRINDLLDGEDVS